MVGYCSARPTSQRPARPTLLTPRLPCPLPPRAPLYPPAFARPTAPLPRYPPFGYLGYARWVPTPLPLYAPAPCLPVPRHLAALPCLAPAYYLALPTPCPSPLAPRPPALPCPPSPAPWVVVVGPYLALALPTLVPIRFRFRPDGSTTGCPATDDSVLPVALASRLRPCLQPYAPLGAYRLPYAPARPRLPHGWVLPSWWVTLLLLDCSYLVICLTLLTS